MITCKNCSTVYSAEYKFCPNCGKPSDTVACPSCFATIPAGSTYCPKCAAPISHTEKCGFCGGMNAKNSKFCSTCGKTLKTSAEIASDVARIKAVIPMLRAAIEEHEQQQEQQPAPAPAPALTKKELKAKRKMEKIAAKAGFTLVDPDEIVPEVEAPAELEANDLLAALPVEEPECECTCDCCDNQIDPVVEMIREQNERIEKVLNKLVETVEKKETAPAAPAAPAAPCYPFPVPYMPQPAPAAPAQPIVIQQPAPAAPAQPIVIQQPAPAASNQPIVIQQPAAPAQSVVVNPGANGATIQPVVTEIVTSDGKKVKKPKKSRFLAFLMLLVSGGFLASMIMLPMLIAPATAPAVGAFTGLDIARAIFTIGGEGMAALYGTSTLAQAVAQAGFTEISVLTILNYVIFALVLISIAFAAFDVLFSVFRFLSGKIKKRRGTAVRISLLCYLLVIIISAVATAIVSGDFVNTIISYFTAFLAQGESAVLVLGLGGVVGLGLLVFRLLLNIFVRKSR